MSKLVVIEVLTWNVDGTGLWVLNVEKTDLWAVLNGNERSSWVSLAELAPEYQAMVNSRAGYPAKYVNGVKCGLYSRSWTPRYQGCC